MGRVPKASRLMLTRWRADTLSVVMLLPHVPQPRVSEGVRPVAYPMAPWVPEVLARIRKAGFSRANLMMTSWSWEWITMLWPIPP